MIGGVYGKVLHVDLTRGSSFTEELDSEIYRLLVGGRALVAYYLLRDLPPHIDPLSPENILIFAPGIFQGNSLPGSGRHGVGGKSPLTGCIGSSEVGGWWGDEFKRTGFDALVIHGRAKHPVYLWIKNDQVEIRPAEKLWGLDIAPAQAAIREDLGDERIRVAQIGIAGENQVRYAAIMHDINRAAGRNGLGALMGSKNLKAIAIRGTQKPIIADRPRLLAVSKWFIKDYKTSMDWACEGIGIGTLDSIEIWDALGGLPTHNFSEPTFQNAEKIYGDKLHEQFLDGRDTCQACPVHCKQVFEHKSELSSQNIDPVYGGAEYEAVAGFGPNCGVSEPLAVLKANELCNTYGLDTISTGAVIAFVMECFESGVLSARDTDNLEFRWGNSETMLSAIECIAHRQGFGDMMAEGVARMSARLGSETDQFNLTIKGQEIPMHEPRLKQAMGLGFALSPMGADHIVNIHDTYYMSKDAPTLKRVNAFLENPIAPISARGINEDKIQIMVHEISFQHFQDCAVLCHFYPYNYQNIAEALSGITGVTYSAQDILNIGRRAETLARIFNFREGFTVKDDSLPKRLMNAFNHGPLAGVAINSDEFEWAKMVGYHELMDWDCKSGLPTSQCISNLELDHLGIPME